MTDPTTPQRRPYTGSCHCGFVKYIIYLTFPHNPPPANNRRGPDGKLLQNMYRCNCTTCQKLGLMHIRLPSPPDDFQVLSPLNPPEELGDYQCFEKQIHWLFCKTCGVRCFSFMGESETVEREVMDPQTGETNSMTVWSPRQGWHEDMTHYLSVNGYTIDAGQEGCDLREWTEKKWVLYLDCLRVQDTGPDRRYERPFEGGAY